MRIQLNIPLFIVTAAAFLTVCLSTSANASTNGKEADAMATFSAEPNRCENMIGGAEFVGETASADYSIALSKALNAMGGDVVIAMELLQNFCIQKVSNDAVKKSSRAQAGNRSDASRN